LYPPPCWKDFPSCFFPKCLWLDVINFYLSICATRSQRSTVFDYHKN
jgi:hypothetical protein